MATTLDVDFDETPLEDDGVVARAQRARDSIEKELSRLQAQQRGLETKIASLEQKLLGANEVLAAIKPAKKGAASST